MASHYVKRRALSANLVITAIQLQGKRIMARLYLSRLVLRTSPN